MQMDGCVAFGRSKRGEADPALVRDPQLLPILQRLCGFVGDRFQNLGKNLEDRQTTLSHSFTLGKFRFPFSLDLAGVIYLIPSERRTKEDDMEKKDGWGRGGNLAVKFHPF